MGRRQPMTPVDSGRTASRPPGMPSVDATAAHTRSLASTPSPAAHTFEILLFTMTACTGFWLKRRSRMTLIGAPGKRLRVITAA